MNYTKLIKRSLQATLAAGALLTFSATTFVQAQEASTTYKGAGRDPFTKYKPRPAKKVKVNVKAVPQPIAAPSIAQRIAAYKTQKAIAMNAQLPVPKPTTALLLNEAHVTGIFRTPRGYAAMVEAKPIKLSYVIYPGESFYDGQLVAVEENRLVFRRVTNFSDGKRDIKVEMKPLRKANAVSDGMTSRSGAPVAPPPPPASSTTVIVPSSLPE